ncbi:MAG: hypothetical protein II766_01185 [Paludibacteraceae bacterium]|nr:hypothetical protein [Paludibacteraceae bacterium]
MCNLLLGWELLTEPTKTSLRLRYRPLRGFHLSASACTLLLMFPITKIPFLFFLCKQPFRLLFYPFGQPLRFHHDSNTTPIRLHHDSNTTPIRLQYYSTTTPIRLQYYSTTTPIRLHCYSTATPLSFILAFRINSANGCEPDE